MPQLSVFCPAKVNLFLNISLKRNDNYHSLQSLFHTVNWYDKLILNKQKKFQLIIDPQSKIKSKTEHYDLQKNNLLETIYQYFVENYFITPISITLIKNIPLGAGLGGGSSDAAGLIHAINELFNLSLSLETKQKIGFLFGCDIPYFLTGGLAWVSGKGEKIFSLPSPFVKQKKNVLLFYPNTFVSTAKAYQKYVTFKRLNFKKKKKRIDCFFNTVKT